MKYHCLTEHERGGQTPTTWEASTHIKKQDLGSDITAKPFWGKNQYIITLCQLLKVFVAEGLEDTGGSLGDGDGLSLPRGDARRRHRGGAAVLRHTAEDLAWQKKDACSWFSWSLLPILWRRGEDYVPSCVPQSESQRQYFGILCPTWLPRSPPGPSSAWVQRWQPCWRESCGCLHCDRRHCGQTPSLRHWGQQGRPCEAHTRTATLTWPSAWSASQASPDSSLVTCR